jgi:MOSC domain-containing protein YiiM
MSPVVGWRRMQTSQGGGGAGVIEAIYVTRSGGAPMQGVIEVQALEGRGLAGDRYLMRTGYWTGVDECEVTLIEAESLEEVESHTDVRVSGGEHRRNIVTRGVRLRELAGKRFTIGEAVFSYDRPRPPCRYIASITQRGMTKALGRHRGGICARVVATGVIRVGDALRVEESAPKP